MTPDTPQAATLEAAIAIALDSGYASLTRDAVATRAGVATGMVNKIWGDTDGLRDAVMHAAVLRGLLPIVAHGLVARHPAAMAAPEAIRRAAASSIVGGV